MAYFTVGELKVGLYAVLVAVLILLFIVISICYACWLAKHGRKRAEAREKAVQANTHSWGNDVYLDPDDYGKDDSTVVGNLERGSRASVPSDSDGELPNDTRSRQGDEYKGKLTRGKSGLRDHSTKAKVSLRRNLGPLNENQEATGDTDDVDAAAMLGEEKLERWSETARMEGGDESARGLDSGASSPEPAEGSQPDPYATRERALKAIQAERANKPAVAVAAADKSNYLAAQSAESRAPSTATSEVIKATLGRREVTKAELEELYRTAFDQGVLAAGGAQGPGVVRRVTPAQLDRLWETAFEDGARAAGATEAELTNARQAYAAERARKGVFKATVDLTQLQIEQMWTEAFDEGGRAGARLLAGRGLDSQRRSPYVHPVPLHVPTAHYPAAVGMPSRPQEHVLPTAVRDAPRRKGKQRSMPQAPREPAPTSVAQRQVQWSSVAGPSAGGIDPYMSGQYPSYAGHLPPQPWDPRLAPPPGTLPMQAYPNGAWGAGDPYAYNAANPYAAEAAQALPAVVVSPPTRKLGRKSMSGSSRRAMEKKVAKEERRRRAEDASSGFAPYGDAPYQPIGVATANPELKRELVASFASGYIRPTYPEPMPPPMPGYTAQSAPLW